MPGDLPKPSALFPSFVPKDVKDFVDCTSSEVSISPQELVIGGFKVKLTFEAGGKGSITIRLDAPGEFLDSSIDVSIQNGQLVADTSKLRVYKDEATKWIKDFNGYLDTKGNQLSGVSIQNGKLHVTKSPVISGTETRLTPFVEPPMTPQEPSHHTGHPLPEPVGVESKEVVTTTDSIPDLADLGTEAVSDTGLEDSDLPRGTEGSAAGERVHIEPSDIAVGHLGTEDLKRSFWPFSSKGRRTMFAAIAGMMAIYAVFQFAFDDTPVVPQADLVVEAVADPGQESATEDQPSEEPAADGESASDAEQSTPPPGSDPEGDGKNGNSEQVTEEEDVSGADMTNALYRIGPSGEHIFIIDVVSDGEKAATDTNNDYRIDIEIPGPDGWGTTVEFDNGELKPGKVFLGELASGRDTLEGAEVSVEWTDSDTMEVTVAGTGTDLGGVDTFAVDISVFFPGGSFHDHAEGIGAP